MKKQYETSEYSELNIAGYTLTPRERSYLRALSYNVKERSGPQRFYFDELAGSLRIRTLSWIGVIELEQLRLAITPKFDRGFTDLIDLICFITHIPFYNWHDQAAGYGENDFMELIMRLYLFELDILLNHGLVKEYVTEEDNLRQLRGRPDFMQSLRKNYATPTRVYCHYDELVANITENQVIRSVLELARRFKLYDQTRRQVNLFCHELEKICDPYRGLQWPVFYYHRLNTHYEKIHRLSRYIYENCTVSEIYSPRQQSFFSMLIDMNELFEQFVGEILRRYLPRGYRLESGRHLPYAIVSAGQTYRYVIPDIVISNRFNQQKVVLDTKYKPYGTRKVDNSDLYQLAFYAQYFNRDMDSGYRSVIVYPEFAGETGERRLTINLLPHTPYRGAVEVKAISIENLLTDIKENRRDLQAKALALL